MQNKIIKNFYYYVISDRNKHRTLLERLRVFFKMRKH